VATTGTCVLGTLLLGALALPAMACDLPKLPVIPPADQIGDQAPAVSTATGAYFDGMRVYADCIEDELAAAGGDAAPASVKAALVYRSNAAVAEAQAIQKLFQERVAAGQSATPGSEAALRKLIEGIISGAPDYDAMTEAWARLARQQMGFVKPAVTAGGAIQDIAFGGIDPDGRNIFQVTQEHGTLNARIGLDADGKIDFYLLRPAPVPGEKKPFSTIPRRH
jgi:hypothetical protein